MGKRGKSPPPAAAGAKAPRPRRHKDQSALSPTWEGPSVDDKDLVTIMAAALQAGESVWGGRATPVRLGTVSCTAVPPGPTVVPYLEALRRGGCACAPEVSWVAQVVRSSELAIVVAASRPRASHLVRLDGERRDPWCVTCRSSSCVGLVAGKLDVVLVDRDGPDIAPSVVTYLRKVTPAITVFAGPRGDTFRTDVAAVFASDRIAHFAPDTGLPYWGRALLSFVCGAHDADKAAQFLSAAKVKATAHPARLLGKVTDDVRAGSRALDDLGNAGSGTPEEVNDVLVEWHAAGGAPPGTDAPALALGQWPRLSGTTAEGKAAQVLLEMWMNRRGSNFGLRGVGPKHTVHLDGTIMDFRAHAGKALVCGMRQGSDVTHSVLSTADILALLGYDASAHNLSVTSLRARRSSVRKALPASIWVMAVCVAAGCL